MDRTGVVEKTHTATGTATTTDNRSGARPIAVLVFTAALAIIALARAPSAAGIGGYAVVGLFGLAAVLGVTLLGERMISVNYWGLVLFGVFFVIASIHQFLDFQASIALEIVSQAGIVAVALAYLPRVFTFREFCLAAGLSSALVFGIGLIPALGGPTQLGPFSIALWYTASPNPYFPIEASVQAWLGNPNNLGMMITVGGMGALAAFVSTRRWSYGLLTLVAVSGIFAAKYRTGMLIAAAVAMTYVAYLLAGKRGVTAVASLGVACVIAVAAFVAGIIPGLESIDPRTLAWRPQLWAGSVETMLQRPISGYGLGNEADALAPNVPDAVAGTTPHNSFLRTGIATGLIGGIAYTAVFAWAFVASLRSIERLEDVSVFAFVVVLIGIQMFESATVFGTAVESVFMLIALAYVLAILDADVRPIPIFSRF